MLPSQPVDALHSVQQTTWSPVIEAPPNRKTRELANDTCSIRPRPVASPRAPAALETSSAGATSLTFVGPLPLVLLSSGRPFSLIATPSGWLGGGWIRIEWLPGASIARPTSVPPLRTATHSSSALP